MDYLNHITALTDNFMQPMMTLTSRKREQWSENNNY